MTTHAPRLHASAALERLSHAPENSLVVVTAPWGWGKSALVQHWAEDISPHAILVTLDGDVTDPQAFLDRVIASVTTAPTFAPSDGLLERFISVVGSADLVIDGVEHLTDPTARELLFEFLVRAADTQTVVLTGRQTPVLDWSVLRRTRRIIDLDLRMHPITAEDVAAQWPTPVQSAMVRRLIRATAGWVAAIEVGLIHLPVPTAPEQHTGPDLDGPEEQLTAVHTFVRESLVDGLHDAELLNLTQLALRSASTAEFDRAGLTDTSTANLPLIVPGVRPVDRAHFAPVLVDTLIEATRERQPERFEEVVDTAMANLRRHRNTAQALDLATRVGRTRDVLFELKSNGVGLLLAGHTPLITAALAQVPPEVLATRSDFLMLHAWVALHDGSFDQAFHWLSAAEAARREDTPQWSSGGAGPAALMRDVLLDAPGGAQAPGYATTDIPMPWHGLGYLMDGLERVHHDDLNQARALRHAAAPFTAGQPDVEANRLGLLALVAHRAGDQEEWTAALSGVKPSWGAQANPVRSLLLLAHLGLRDQRQGYRERAARRLDEAIHQLGAGLPWFRRARLLSIPVLIETAQGLGRPDALAELAARSIELTELDSANGQPPGQAQPGHHGPPPVSPRMPPLPMPRLSPSEQRVLQRLNTPTPVPRIAEQLHVSVATVRTHVRTIYTKLGVSNRTDAVERAQHLGLLSGESEVPRHS